MAEAEPRTSRKRKIRNEWLLEDAYKSWLTRYEPHQGGIEDELLFCNNCQCTIQPAITSIKRHMVNIFILMESLVFI